MLYCKNNLNKNKVFKLLKTALPFITTIFVIVLFHYTNNICFKCYPAFINLLIFIIFFSSIFQKETIIQKMARIMEPDIKPKALSYTRKLTYVWSLFLFLNFSVAFYSIFANHSFWMFYNGFLSYFLCGMLFIIEYFIRIRFKRKYDC